MTTQIELIEHYSEQLAKVAESRKPTDRYYIHAFFSVQAAEMGIPHAEISDWATKEMERLHQMALDRL